MDSRSDEALPADAGQLGRGVGPLAPERAVYRTQWAARLRTWAEETRQAGRVYALVDAAECNLIAAHLEECTAEIERLTTELREGDDLRERLGDLLRRTAVALRGPEPPLTRWSWHDVPERAAAAVAAIEVMQRAAALAAGGERPNVRANPDKEAAR